MLNALDNLPLEISVGKSLTSVTAVLRGGKPGGAVLLRADMDALPVQEKSDVGFASLIPNVMHACGHDLHTAGLVGAAHLLSERRADLHGDVVFMFQPGEEGSGGAKIMIDEGVLDAADKPLDAAYAIHVAANQLPAGSVVTRGGPVMTASDCVTVEVRGRGGHGSTPHTALDPLPAACEMVTAIQTWISRTFDVFDPVIVSVGTFHAGAAINVIADTATFTATLRSYSAAAHARLQQGIPHLLNGIAHAHGLTVDIDYHVQYPVTVNSPAHADFAIEVAEDLLGPDQVWTPPHPAAGSEDFSYVLEQVPGAMLLVGATPNGTDPTTAAANHSPHAEFDESALPVQAAILTELATRRLETTANQKATDD